MIALPPAQNLASLPPPIPLRKPIGFLPAPETSTSKDIKQDASKESDKSVASSEEIAALLYSAIGSIDSDSQNVKVLPWNKKKSGKTPLPSSR